MTTPAISKHRISRKASLFTESVIREMTREALKHGAVNLSQGFPDFAAPEDIKRVAMKAIEDDINQYAITWGARDFREAIAKKTKWYLGLDVDPETELTVTCGSTEGMIAAMMATVDPGEEVVVFEPFYENYAPDAILSDATPRYVPLRRLTGVLIARSCVRFSTPRHKRSFSAIQTIRPARFSRARRWSLLPGSARSLTRFASPMRSTNTLSIRVKARQIEHISMAQLPGMRERTVIVNSMSKTYSVTGWRVGYCIAPPDITSAIRKVHDFLNCGAAAPLQAAGAYALSLPAVLLRQAAG